MASHWVKSLQCKSTAFDDVHHPKPIPFKKPLLPIACSNSQSLKDAVFLQDPKPKPKRPKKPKPVIPSPPPVDPASSFPTLAELPPGHSSRRVVEIIFGSSWAPAAPSSEFSFPGRIEMLFRVHNQARTVTRFEEYRSAVRSGASDDVRCSVDGNEMMRFHCAPPISSPNGEIYDAGVVSLPGGGKSTGKCKGKAVDGIRTFKGSGGTHESAGGGPGRRAMLVSRVIAGRVRSGSDPESSGESVSAGRGEIVVFDSRAVLPCFLIIYKIS